MNREPRFRRATAILAALTLSALPLLSTADAASPPAFDGTILNRLPANWRDDRGQALSLPAMRGKPLFVTMAYATCHRICPTTITRLIEIQHDFDAQGTSAEFLIVGYDPENDDPVAWRRYRAEHELMRPNWHFLVGTPAETEQLAQTLGFEYWRDGDHVMHDFRIVALGSDGSWRGVLDSSDRDWRTLP